MQGREYTMHIFVAWQKLVLCYAFCEVFCELSYLGWLPK
jgi:hypothetical protein